MSLQAFATVIWLLSGLQYIVSSLRIHFKSEIHWSQFAMVLYLKMKLFHVIPFQCNVSYVCFIMMQMCEPKNKQNNTSANTSQSATNQKKKFRVGCYNLINNVYNINDNNLLVTESINISTFCIVLFYWCHTRSKQRSICIVWSRMHIINEWYTIQEENIIQISIWFYPLAVKSIDSFVMSIIYFLKSITNFFMLSPFC